jgi:hypothetical protein
MNPFGAMQGAQAGQQGISNPSRPFGVTLIAAAVGFVGGLYLLLMFFSLCSLNFLSSFVSPGNSGSLNLFSFFVPDTATSILFILYISVLAFGHLALSRGLFQLKTWAYWTTLLLEGFNALVSLIQLTVNHNGLAFFTTIYIPVLIIAYLLAMSSVRRAFRVLF